MTEKWRDIPGYEGCYQVSTAGRVRSLDREKLVVCSNRSYVARWRGRVLKTFPDHDGYIRVTLGADDKRRVHSLVLLVFVGLCPDNHEVLHKNHNAADARLRNLKYGTRSENLKMDYANGSRVKHKRKNT